MAAAGAGGAGAGLGAHFVGAIDPSRDLWTYSLTEVIRRLYGDQASNSFKLGGIKDFREIFEHFDPTRQCLEVIGGPYILDKIININTKVLSQADAQLAVAKQKKAAPPGATVENCWICGLPIDEAIPGLKSECEHVLPVMQAALFLELFGSKHVQLKKKLEEEMKALVNSEKELNKVQSKKMVGLLQAATEKVISAKKNVEIAGKAYVDGLRILKLEYLWAHAGCNRLKHNDSYITSGFLTNSMGQNLRCAIVNETVILNFFKELYYTSKKVEVLPVRTLIHKTYPPDPAGTYFLQFYQRQLEYFKKYLQPICNYINQCIGQKGCTITYDQICAASIEKLASPTAIRAEYYPIMENALNTIKISKESAQFAAFSKYVNDAFRKKMLALFTDPKTFIPLRLIEFKTKLNEVYNKLIDDKLFQIFADLRLRLFMMYKKNDNSDSLINNPTVHTNISELFYYLFIKYSIKTTSSDYDNSKIVKAYIINDQPVISLIESLYVYNQLSHDLKELTPEDGLEIRDALENTNKSTDITIAQTTSVVVQASAFISQGQQLTLEQQNQVVQAQAARTEAQTTKNKLAEIATIPQSILPPAAIVAELNRNLRLCQNFTNTVLPPAQPGQVAPEILVYQQLIQENIPGADTSLTINAVLNAADAAAAALLLQLKDAPPYPELTNPHLYDSEKKQLEELHIFQALLSIIDICNIPNPNVIGSNNYYYNESQRLDDIISIVNTLAQYNDHQNLAYLKSEIYANKYSLFNEIIEEYIIDTAHFSDLNDTAPTAIAIATFRAHAARTNKPFFDLPEPNTDLHARYIKDFKDLPITSRTYEITVLVLYLRAIANEARARRVDSRAIKTQNKNLFILAEIAEGLIAPDSEIIGVRADGVGISIPANNPGFAAAINPLMHFATIAAENSFELAKASALGEQQAVADLTTGGFFKYPKRRHSKTHVKKRQCRKQKHAKTIRRRNKQQVKKRPIKTHRRRILKRNKSRKYRT
jgi:hypothetical protein